MIPAIKGVIVRIDSPGGESTASDDMWRAMNQLSQKKPMVISMSDAAASGGYYMAMTGDPIVAYPGTLTGSIGVVFGKPNLHGLYDKLGIDKEIAEPGKFRANRFGLRAAGRTRGAQKLREGIDEEISVVCHEGGGRRARRRSIRHRTAGAGARLAGRSGESAMVWSMSWAGIDRAIELVKQKAEYPGERRS